jgi:hypothetical protein
MFAWVSDLPQRSAVSPRDQRSLPEVSDLALVLPMFAWVSDLPLRPASLHGSRTGAVCVHLSEASAIEVSDLP